LPRRKDQESHPIPNLRGKRRPLLQAAGSHYTGEREGGSRQGLQGGREGSTGGGGAEDIHPGSKERSPWRLIFSLGLWTP
jgi:hypothetical protein